MMVVAFVCSPIDNHVFSIETATNPTSTSPGLLHKFPRMGHDTRKASAHEHFAPDRPQGYNASRD